MTGFRESKRAWKEEILHSRRNKQLVRITQGLHYDERKGRVVRHMAVRFGHSPYSQRIREKLLRNRARIQDILQRYCHNPNITFREWNSMIAQGMVGDIAGASQRMWELEKRTDCLADVLRREEEILGKR